MALFPLPFPLLPVAAGWASKSFGDAFAFAFRFASFGSRVGFDIVDDTFAGAVSVVACGHCIGIEYVKGAFAVAFPFGPRRRRIGFRVVDGPFAVRR